MTFPGLIGFYQTFVTNIATRLLLTFPDFSRQLILARDASDFAKAAAFSQEYDGNDLPAALASQPSSTMLNCIIRDSTIERELTAIVCETSYFRSYLYGRAFFIVTNHAPLK